MAHLVVLLQRTPSGLHPGSATGLCVARDVADTRGATLSAICEGDAGNFDDKIVAQASLYGADSVIFVGPHGLRDLCARWRPLHIFVPWTPLGIQAGRRGQLGEIHPAWINDPVGDPDALPAVVGVVSGVLPWQQAPLKIEADYEATASEMPLPEWLEHSRAGNEPADPDADLYYVAPPNLDPQTAAALSSLGATAISPDQATSQQSGVLLWFDAGPNGLPASLEARPPAARVVLFAGPAAQAKPHHSWSLADWVIEGPWTDAVRDLQGTPWKTALA